MKRVKFTLGLMLSFLLMGASVSVNAQSAGLSATLIAMGCPDGDSDGVISPTEFSLWTQPTTLTIPAATAANLTNDSISELVDLFPNVTSIDVSACTNAGFTTLDVSGKTALATLTPAAGLTSLNVSGSGLTSLSGLGTSLTTLDASNCPDLTSLDCSTATALTTLNVGIGVANYTLDISNTQVENLVLAGDTALTSLTLNDKIKTLNASGCTKLATLDYTTNSAPLETLNVSETALTSLSSLPTTLTTLDASNCPDLTSLDCSTATALTTLNVGIGVANYTLDISNTQVENLVLAGDTALTSLTLNDKIKTLNASGCTKLATLDYTTNSAPLETLNVSETALTSLSNLPASLTELDATSCPALTSLNCSTATALETLKVGIGVADYTLDISNTQVENLVLAGDTALTNLTLNDKIKTLDVSGCTKLATLNCSAATALEKLNVSESGLTSLSNLPESLTELDASKCPALNSLDTPHNGTISSLKVNDCAALTTLDCSGENLTELDLTGCTGLTTLDCSDNNIKELNISGNTSLVTINIGQKDDFTVTIDPAQETLPGIAQGGRDDNLKDVIGSDIITAKEYHSITMVGDDVYGGLEVDKKALADYRVTIGGKNRAPGYQLSSVTVYNEDGTEVTVDREGFGTINASGSFIMPNNAVTVYYKYERIPNPDWYNITVDEKDKDGNTTTGGIDVPGKAQEGAIVTIKPHFTFDPNTDGHTNSDPNSANYPIQVIDSEGKRVALTALGDGSFTFIMPYHNVTVSFTSATSNGETGFPDPVVYRTVQIISNGLETLPKATNGSNGYHYVAGHQDFKFTVISSNPINVTTNRKNNVLGDAIIVVDNGDGTWSVTIRQVTTNLIVTVSDATTESGTGENGTTGNEAIAKDAVWAANGTLYVRTATPGFMAIYNVTGQLCKQVAVSGDATFTLSRGIYIVQLNGKAYKVVL